MSEHRSYVVGLPVVITVHDDGTVKWEIDKGEAADDLDEHGDSGYDDDVISADAAIIRAAVQREWEDSRRKRVLTLADDMRATLTDPTQAWDIAVADFTHEVHRLVHGEAPKAPRATYHGLVRAKCRTCGTEVTDIDAVEAWNDIEPSCACDDDAVRVYEWEDADGKLTLTRLHDSDVDDVTGFPTHWQAFFQPEAWVRDYALVVDPEGEQAWRCTDYVMQHFDYVRGLLEKPDQRLRDSRDRPMYDVTDTDDVFKSDPAAPQWVREWSGPFTIVLTGSEVGPGEEV